VVIIVWVLISKDKLDRKRLPKLRDAAGTTADGKKMKVGSSKLNPR
jgi:hypothetical protein